MDEADTKKLMDEFNTSKSAIYNILKNKDTILAIPNSIIVNNNMQIICKNSIPEIENLLIHG